MITRTTFDPVKRYLLAASLSLSCAAAIAHPYHASTTTLEFNTEHHSLEFTLRLPTEDVAAVTCPARPCNNAQEATLISYLKQRISLRYADQVIEDLQFIGTESDFRVTWIYFEIKLPGGAIRENRFCLDYPIMTELNPRQINTIDYRSNALRRTVSLTAQAPRECFELK